MASKASPWDDAGMELLKFFTFNENKELPNKGLSSKNVNRLEDTAEINFHGHIAPTNVHQLLAQPQTCTSPLHALDKIPTVAIF